MSLIVSLKNIEKSISNYKKPIIFKNGLTPISKIGLSVLLAIFAFMFYFHVRPSPTSIITFMIFISYVASSSEFREGEVTIRRGMYSKIIPIDTISKAEICKWKLRVYFQDGDMSNSISLPGAITNDKQDAMIKLLKEGSSSLIIEKNDGLLSALY